MKKIGILLFVTTLGTGLVLANCFSFGRSTGKFLDLSFSLGREKGSGNILTEKRSLPAFHALDVGGVFQVEVTSQSEPGVAVEADDNLLPFIQTQVVDGVLTIDSDKRLNPTSTIRIRVSAADIDAVQTSGASVVNISNIKNADFAIDSSGASKVSLAGETQRLKADLSGATKVNAEEMKADTAAVDSSGASQMSLSVSTELRAGATGASRISYLGEPTSVDKHVSGAASVTKK